MKEDFYNPFRIFKVPDLPEKLEGTKHKVVIGLIDASGSMGSFWKDMAKFWNHSIAEHAHFLITFSQRAKLEETPYLNEDLKKHGGGMTNIFDAFKLLEERLEHVDVEAPITIVFISDGQDTVNGENKLKREMKKLKGGNKRDITFLCLGIKSGFPTFISMELRNLYHTGDEKLPAVFLIEYVSEKAFFNKFESMSDCFKSVNSIKAPEAGDYCKEYPWEQPGHVKFLEGKWILVHKEFKNMKIVYNDAKEYQFEVRGIESLNLEDIVDCFRGWVQKIQLLSMDNAKMKQVQDYAAEAALTVREFTREFEQHFGFYIIRDKPIEVKESFKTRAMNLAIKNIGSRIKWYLDELDIIAKGSGIGQLNQYEAAKRIAIGTITGKYHQKALALKGITVKDFLEIKEEFTVIYKNTKLSEKESEQEPSIFTLQNQKEVLSEPDFLDGLNFCKTQFDLMETFPVVGYGLKIKRYDGSMINPWKVRLQALAKHHKTIDSMYLARNSNKYELSVGNDEVEEINAVLPLFDLQDGQMSDLFNTRLFKLAVSFMVVQNIDTYHEQAYLALLGSTFLFLLRQPVSEWRQALIKKVYTSIKVTYGATVQFQKFITDVEENPITLFKAKSQEDHVDIVKVMLIIFYISCEDRLEKEKVMHLVDLALVHYTEKTFVENQFKIFRVADVKLNLDENGLEGEQKMPELNTIMNDEELKVLVDKQMHIFMKQNCLNIELSEKIFRHEDEERRVVYPQIDKYYSYFKGEPLQKDQMLFYFGHYLQGKSEQNYSYNSPVLRDIKIVEKLCSKQINPKDLTVGEGKRIKKFRKSIQQKYLNHFRDCHFGILPITPNKLKIFCESNGYNINDYDLNVGTGLIRNTCMSPHCVYFMKKMKPAEVHDHLRLWRGQMPARFHLTVMGLIREKKTAEQIALILMKMNLVNSKKHKKDQTFVIEYVKAIQEVIISKNQ